jgi:hypothetical protein
MPHFLCPQCAFLGYSAADESCCPSCYTPLRRVDQLHPAIPHAESIRPTREPSTRAGRGRFGKGAQRAIPEGGLE